MEGMDPEERARLWRKLDSIEEKATTSIANTGNLDKHISAVSQNVRELRAELNEHKENTTDAHGLGSAGRTSDRFLVIASLVLSAIGAIGIPLVLEVMKRAAR